jgi:toxin CcdB
MAQFDVYRMADGDLVLDVQTDLLGSFDSRVVVPLMLSTDAPIRHPRLNPEVVVGDQTLVMVTQFMIAVDRSELRTRIDNLDRYYDQLKFAYDMLFNGF